MQSRAETGQSLPELLEAGQKGKGRQSRCRRRLGRFTLTVGKPRGSL